MSTPAIGTYSIMPWHTDLFAALIRLSGVDVGAFCGKGRHPLMVSARRVIWTAMRQYVGPGKVQMSYPEIAKASGRTNHSTVMSAVARATDAQVEEAIRLIERYRQEKAAAA